MRLCCEEDIFGRQQHKDEDLILFENRDRNPLHQAVHSDTTVEYLTYDLKTCLEGLARHLFGKGMLQIIFSIIINLNNL